MLRIFQNMDLASYIESVSHSLFNDPNFLVSIATVVIAIATVVNTVYIVLNIIDDKPKLIIKTSLSMKLINQLDFNDDNTYTTITLANIGKRPIYVGAIFLIYKDKSTFYLSSSESKILSPEHFYTCNVEESELDLKKIKYIIVKGSGDRSYKFSFNKTLSGDAKNLLQPIRDKNFLNTLIDLITKVLKNDY